MTKEEFLEKYAEEKVFFLCLYENRAMYKNCTNTGKTIGCSGIVKPNNIIRCMESVQQIAKLEDFIFTEVNNED